MKRNKILAFVLTAAILVTLVFGSTVAYAAGNFQLTAVESGGKVTVTFSAATSISKLAGFQINVTAPAGFTYESYTMNSLFQSISNEDELMFQGQEKTYDGADIASGTALVTIVFTAPEDASGSYDFSAVVASAYDVDYNDLDVGETKTATVTFPEPTPEPTEPPVEPTEPPVEPTEPPVEPTEPPVEPTEPPVEPTEPPVEPTAHRASRGAH